MSSRYGFNSANGSLDASFRDIELQPIFLTIEDDDDYGNYTAVTQIGFAHTPSVPAAPVQSLRGSPLLPPVQILPAFPIRTISPDPEVMQFDVDVSGISSKPSVVTESKQRLLPKDDPKADLSARLKALNAKFPKFSIGQLKTFYEQFQFFDEDGSGDIDEEELERVLESAGQRPRRHELKSMIAEHDPLKTGSISFEAFVSMVNDIKSGKTAGGLGEIYGKVFDVGALLTAAGKGDVYNLTSILSDGTTDPNSSDYDARTALHLAASEGHLDAVRCLMTYKADVNVKDRWGNTPLDDAVRGNKMDVVKHLQQSNAKFGNEEKFKSDLIAAASSGDTEAVRHLIKMGIDPSSADYDDRSALHVAVANGHQETAEVLIKSKANVNAVDRWGGTPLTEAVRTGESNSIATLLCAMTNTP